MATPIRIPELYEDNLITLTKVLHSLEDLTKIDGVFGVEIRVRVDDVESWAVIGWGDASEPCILRFEDDFEPILTPNPNIHINPGVFVSKAGEPEFKNWPDD